MATVLALGNINAALTGDAVMGRNIIADMKKFEVPKNTPRWMQNTRDEEGCLLWQDRPAMKTQAFLDTMWRLEADGKTNSFPNLIQLTVILREYSDEFRAVNPPYWVQRILFALLSPLWKLLGYQASYRPYSSAD